MLESDPDKINDLDRVMESRILESGNAYSASHRRSRDENRVRAGNRAKIKDMGMRTDAYQVGVRIVKDLTESERKDFLRDLNLVVKVLGSRQQELFPEEALKAATREAKRKAKLTGKEGAPDPDTNPNSAPRIVILSEEGMTVESSDLVSEEQAEGDAVLEAMAPETTAAKKKSQSQIAREKSDAASGKGPSIN